MEDALSAIHEAQVPANVKEQFLSAVARKIKAVEALRAHVAASGGAHEDCDRYLDILLEYEGTSSRAYAEKKTAAFAADFDAKLADVLACEQECQRRMAAVAAGSGAADAVVAPALERLRRFGAAVAAGGLAERRQHASELLQAVNKVDAEAAVVMERMAAIRATAAQLAARGVAGMSPIEMDQAWHGLLDRVAENPLEVVVGYAEETLEALTDMLARETRRENAEQERLMSLIADDEDDEMMDAPPPCLGEGGDKENAGRGRTASAANVDLGAVPMATPGKRSNSTGSAMPAKTNTRLSSSSTEGDEDGEWEGAADSGVLDEIFGDGAGNPNTEQRSGDITQKRFSIALEKERSLRKRNMKRVEREGVKKRQRLQQWKEARQRANQLMAKRRDTVATGGSTQTATEKSLRRHVAERRAAAAGSSSSSSSSSASVSSGRAGHA